MIKWTSLLLVFQLVSLLIFCVGFFPQKNVLKGDADFTIEQDLQEKAQPIFNKFVLVVVDALRSDFVFDKANSKFSFVHSLLNEGNAWGFTAYSNPPTVTLPRLKGITTGSTPNFLDAILNVAEDDSSSNLSEQDSWLRQMQSRGKVIRFFGDDTWLKLFPLEFFQQHDGTNSFFVSDFEQVDFNVTRHIPEQLAHKDEWDVLILHYLGLDHIGHKGGPKSQFMPSKQVEMDSVVKNLYESVDDQTLICLMGDHGMNEVGNHGGSSPGETSAALVLISKQLQEHKIPAKQENVQVPIELDSADDYNYLTRIQQVDIVPTLSALFNFPIPKNNVGIIIPDILQLLSPALAVVKLKENYHQLTSILSGDSGSHINFEYADIPNILDRMKDIQIDLTKSATNYNYNNLAFGIIAISITTITVLCLGYSKMKIGPSSGLLLLISVLIGFSSFGSSFVEEEHQIWWWIITGLILMSSIVSSKKLTLHFLILLCARFIRGWNNSGQKYTYDTVMSILLKKNYTAQWYLNLVTILVVGLQGSSGNLLTFVSTFILSGLCFIYKISWAIVNRESVPAWMHNLAQSSCHQFLSSDEGADVIKLALVPLAQVFFQCFLAIFLIRLLGAKLMGFRDDAMTELAGYISILLIFQSPTSNIGLFLIFHILKKLITRLIRDCYKSNVYLIAIVSLVMQYFTFFQFGGTNSIASADLSNAYNGVSENYNIYMVGFMMCFSNFAPTIYWSTFTWPLIYNSNEKWTNFAKNKLVFLIFNCVSGCSLFAACYALRFHLFIWSVFSPRLCYFATWNIFMNLIMGWILEGLII